MKPPTPSPTRTNAIPTSGTATTQAISTDPKIALRMLQTQAQLQQRATSALADVLGLDPAKDIRPQILAAAAMAGVAAAVAQWYASNRQADRRTLVNAAYEEVATAGELLHQPIPRAQGNSTSPPSEARTHSSVKRGGSGPGLTSSEALEVRHHRRDGALEDPDHLAAAVAAGSSAVDQNLGWHDAGPPWPRANSRH